MPRIAYVNGRYEAADLAVVHIEDRGYQFSDGIYEVFLYVNGDLWDADGHFRRLQRSLAELKIAEPLSQRTLRIIIGKLVRKNRLKQALVYLQVTRGVAPRNHIFPPEDTAPGIVITAKPLDLARGDAAARAGAAVITAPDIRWGRVDIKTIGLLPNLLAKQAAHEQGAAEAWLVRDGYVTEGSASNAWIIDENGTLVTHPKGVAILGGITRETVIACAEELQIKIEERAFTLSEVENATEAFLTSATNLVMPVISIDGKKIGDGAPGPIAKRLRDAYVIRCGRPTHN